MKKREQRLHLHRETLAKLESQELEPKALRKVNGGDVSSCIQPHCGCLEPY